MVWTPLFLNAVPQITGKICKAMVALRMPARISSLVMASPSMNLCISASSCSLIPSIMCSRYSLAFSFKSSGIPRAHDRGDHVLAVFLGLFLQVFRNLHHVVLRTQGLVAPHNAAHLRSEEHTSELQSRQYL